MFATLTVSALISACASFSPDGGMSFVQDQAGGELAKDVVKIRNEGEAAAAQLRVSALLARPMTADTAVQIALLNNRGLQAAYNDLGISEAEMVEFSLPPAPSVSLARLTGTGLEIERQILQNVLALLTLPRRREIAEDRFHQAQVSAVEATLRTAVDARRAYYRSVAANQIVRFLEQSRTAAESLSDVAKKLGETGAFPKLDQARQHAFYAEVSSQLALARLRQRGQREKLNRALGLWGRQTKFRLPDSLKGLPAPPKSSEDIEALAVTSRADLEIQRLELVILAKEYGLTHATRFIDVLEISGLSRFERSDDEQTSRRGLEVGFQIPIYDFGEARTRRAEETYMEAVNLLIEKAVNVRSEAREAYDAYRSAYDIARHFEKEILPLRETISEQELLNYNGMLTDLFALLTDARARITANVQAIEAKRDFWLAKVDLQAAIVGGGGGESSASRPGGTTLAADSGGD